MGDWRDPPSQLCPPSSRPFPPQKFQENNRENNSLFLSNNSLLLKSPPPLVNLLGKTLSSVCNDLDKYWVSQKRCKSLFVNLRVWCIAIQKRESSDFLKRSRQVIIFFYKMLQIMTATFFYKVYGSVKIS